MGNVLSLHANRAASRAIGPARPRDLPIWCGFPTLFGGEEKRSVSSADWSGGKRRGVRLFGPLGIAARHHRCIATTPRGECTGRHSPAQWMRLMSAAVIRIVVQTRAAITAVARTVGMVLAYQRVPSHTEHAMTHTAVDAIGAEPCRRDRARSLGERSGLPMTISRPDEKTLIEAFSIIEDTPNIDGVVSKLRDLLHADHVVYHSSKLGAKSLRSATRPLHSFDLSSFLDHALSANGVRRRRSRFARGLSAYDSV